MCRPYALSTDDDLVRTDCKWLFFDFSICADRVIGRRPSPALTNVPLFTCKALDFHCFNVRHSECVHLLPRGLGASVRTELEHVWEMNRRFTRNAIRRAVFSLFSPAHAVRPNCVPSAVSRFRFPENAGWRGRGVHFFAFKNKNHFAISSVLCAQFSLICTPDP